VRYLTKRHQVTTVNLDRQGITDNGVAIQCVELNAVHYER
jgi:hypothetical protein